jgi:RNA polymerase sigma-70 factor (ECF subfamily)
VNSYQSDSEKSATRGLVERIVAGDREAFRALMVEHQRYAYILAIRLLRNDDDAKDVVQEAFIRVWNNLGRYRPEIKFTTWLYTIIVNLCYDKMKMEARRKGIFGQISGLFGIDELADSRDLHKETEHRDLKNLILAAAQKLSPMQRLVFHLRDIQDCTIEEIAKVAGISAGSVKTNLCYARKRICAAVSTLQESERI